MGYGTKPLLISASMDTTIRLWDVATQKQLETLQYKESQVNSMCITPDGAQFLVGAWQNLRIYDLNCLTPSGLHNSTVHEKNVTSVGFQADGAWMYTGGEDCMAKIWDMRINQLNCQRIFQVNTSVHSIALHPNQVELLIADSTGAIYLWDLRSDRDDSLVTEVDLSEYVVHIDIERQGRQCAAVTNRGHLFFWDISHKGITAAKPQIIGQQAMMPYHHGPIQYPVPTTVHPTMVQQQRFVPGDFYAAYPDTGLAPIAPPPPAEMETALSMQPNQITPAPVDQHHTSELAERLKEQIEAEDQKRMLQKQEATTVTEMEQQQSSTFVAANPALLLPSTSTAQPVNVPNSAKYCAKLRAHETFALKCRYRPDGLAIATTSADQSTKLWSVTDHTLLNTFSAPSSKWVWDCAFTNDSAYMITASFDGILRMWELATNSVVRLYQGHSMGITCMAFKDFS